MKRLELPRLTSRWVILLIIHISGHTLISAQEISTPKLMSARDTVFIDSLLAKGKETRSSNRQLALEYLTEALQEATYLNDLKRKGQALNAMGITFAMLEDFPNALEHFEAFRKVQTKLGNYHGVADAFNNLGSTHRYIGNYAESIRSHLAALSIYDSLKTQAGRASTLHNLGIVHDLTGELEQSLAFFKEAYDIRTKENDSINLSSTIHSLSLMYEKIGKLDSALLYMASFLDFVNKHGTTANASYSNNTIGRLFMAQANYDSAQVYLSKSMDIARDLDLKQPLAHVLYNLTVLKRKQEDLDSAILLVDELIELSKTIESKSFLRDGYLLKSEILKDVGLFKQAYTFLSDALEISDSLYEDEKINQLKQWQVKLDVYEKERQIKEQNTELQWLNKQNSINQQNRMLLLLALSLSIVVGLILYRQNQFKKKANTVLLHQKQFIERQKSEIERMNQELNIRMLRAQINPHFIFNALSSIQHFIVSNDKHSSLKYLTKFSTLLRQVLEESVNGKVTLKEEIQLLSIYLELESLRFDGSFHYHIEVDEDLDIDNQELPILIIQPFVENALFHGLLPSQKEKNLNISFQNQEKHITCSIKDNGIGRAAAGKMKHLSEKKIPSRGMEVSINRLRAMYPQEKPEELITISDLHLKNGDPAGTEVNIFIPKD